MKNDRLRHKGRGVGMEWLEIIKNIRITITSITGLSILTILGLLGGAWHYFKKREYHARTDVSVKPIITKSDDVYCIEVTSNIKNIGKSRIMLRQKGTVLDIFSNTAPDSISNAKPAKWEWVGSFDVFEGNQSIESGVSAEWKQVIHIPSSNYTKFRIDLCLVDTKGEQWTATEVLDCGINSTSWRERLQRG